jgi:hypothetical protein
VKRTIRMIFIIYKYKITGLFDKYFIFIKEL